MLTPASSIRVEMHLAGLFVEGARGPLTRREIQDLRGFTALHRVPFPSLVEIGPPAMYETTRALMSALAGSPPTPTEQRESTFPWAVLGIGASIGALLLLLKR
jgi:hypothetical protein